MAVSRYQRKHSLRIIILVSVRGENNSREGVRAGDGGETKSSGPDSSSDVSGESTIYRTSCRDANLGVAPASVACKGV